MKNVISACILFGAIIICVVPSFAQTISMDKSVNPNSVVTGEIVTFCLTINPTTTPMADIVWVIDTTGSMASGINNIITNINSFTTQLSTKGIDYRQGIVTFKDMVADPTPLVDYGFAANDADFSTMLNAVLLSVTGGGDFPESGLEGLVMAAAEPWRAGASKTLILVTDATVKCLEASGNGPLSLTTTCQTLAAQGIVTHAISTAWPPDPGNTQYIPPYSSGLWLDYTSTVAQWAVLFDTLGSMIASYTNVVIRDPLPPELIPVPGTYMGATLTGNELSWTVPSVHRSVPFQICFQATVNSPFPIFITNTAYVSADGYPEAPSNPEDIFYSSPTDTRTRTLTSTQTQTSTASHTPSYSPTQTDSPTQTVTPSKTLTPSETLTPSKTFTVTETLTSSLTYTKTITSSRTWTETPTGTSTPTVTATITLTPIPPFHVFPNPYYQSATDGVKFEGMPPGSKVFIYSLSTEFVWVSDVVEGEIIIWHGQNMQNIPVSSGLYFWVVELPGGSRRIGKVAVIR